MQIVVIFSFFLIVATAHFEAGFKLLSYGNRVVEFKYNDITISTLNDRFVHVGETNKYLFLFDKANTETKVIPYSDISDMVFYNEMVKWDYEDWKDNREKYEQEKKRKEELEKE
ncbi:MAG: hypothetical protein AAF039_16495 [Bacteroidota bacterium]